MNGSREDAIMPSREQVPHRVIDFYTHLIEVDDGEEMRHLIKGQSRDILIHGNRGNHQDSPTMPLTLPDQPLIPKSFHRDVPIVTLIAWGASMLSQDR